MFLGSEICEVWQSPRKKFCKCRIWPPEVNKGQKGQISRSYMIKKTVALLLLGQSSRFCTRITRTEQADKVMNGGYKNKLKFSSYLPFEVNICTKMVFSCNFCFVLEHYLKIIPIYCDYAMYLLIKHPPLYKKCFNASPHCLI